MTIPRSVLVFLFGAALFGTGCRAPLDNATVGDSPGRRKPPELPGEHWLVKIAAADFDRAGEVVTFAVPKGVPTGPLALWDAWGDRQPVPLQMDNQGQATGFIPFQKAGETLTYALHPLPKETMAATVTRENGRLRLDVNGQPVCYYQMDLAPPPREGIDQKIWRGAFLYPIYTPKGVQISDTYPADHPHDHGIWTAWASSYFQGRHVDFWNPHYAYGGTVTFAGLDRMWDGPVDAGFEARHQFMDRTVSPPVAALDETWRVKLFAATGLPARMFDLEFTQTPATNDPLEVQKYTYGGLGVRGHAEWEEKSDLWVLTSEGATNRVKANNQPARWFFMGGNVVGQPAGIAVLCDPANFRAPQTVRMNPDGPFFMYAPVINAGFTITKTQPYVARYRFIVQDGKPDAKFLDACWQGFAYPANATVITP
ncbi:MAG TPA: DUF6807 family protein [Opitutales bacterium]|nr:DUF6807 family protein [Opitutales bacterium]